MARPLDDLLQTLGRHIPELIAIAAVIAGALRAASSKARNQASRTQRPQGPFGAQGSQGSQASPGSQGSQGAFDESDLEARVRRNFEEMMKRRAASSSAPPAPARPTEGARPAAAGVSREDRRIDFDEHVRAEPKSTEPVRVVVRRREPKRGDEPARRRHHLDAARKAVAGTLKSAEAHRTGSIERVRRLRSMLQPKTLRTAVLLREVLDPPIGMRGGADR